MQREKLEIDFEGKKDKFEVEIEEKLTQKAFNKNLIGFSRRLNLWSKQFGRKKKL